MKSAEKRAVRLVPAGLAMIAVTYGLARFAYGLFLPELREAFALDASALGLIGAGSYAGYCVAVAISLVYTARVGPRFMTAAAGVAAVIGMTVIATAPSATFLAAGVLIAGSSSGLASPPMVEAVSKVIEYKWRDRANALINSGTSVGVAFSGPGALLAVGQWRLTWATFAAVGLAVLLWNIAVIPASGEVGGTGRDRRPAEGQRALSLGLLVGSRALPLFAASVGVGLASAAYWTFSRELVVRAGESGPLGSTVFWIVLGVSGLAGGAAGDLVGRFELGAAFRATLLAMSAAIGMLALRPDALSVAYPSAALFGATYITLTGILLVWAVRVFEDRPAMGLGTAFLLIAAGQILGSFIAGALAEATDLSTTFLVFAAAAALATVFGPGKHS